MQQAVQQALAQNLTIDITTTGRNSGRPRRIEIWLHTVDGRLYITGSPGRRDWYANLLAQPCFIFHLNRSAPRCATPRIAALSYKKSFGSATSPQTLTTGPAAAPWRKWPSRTSDNPALS